MRCSWSGVVCFTACYLVLVFTNSFAFALDSPSVLGFERAHRAAPASAAGGEVLFTELSCAACHQTEGAVPFAEPKRGPILDQAGSRLRAEFIRDFLHAPQQTLPGTTMPDLLGALPEEERSLAIDGLAAFLTHDATLRDLPASSAAVDRGQKLFDSTGCLLCHRNEQQTDGPGLSLVGLSKKTSIPALTDFLSEPLQVRPAGRMPHFGWSREEASDLATYLLRDVEVPASVRFQYYEGDWNDLPDFTSIEPVSSGTSVGFDPVVGPRRDNFAVKFDSFIIVPRKARYTFHLGSDDASRLIIDDQVVATVNGVHPLTFATGAMELTEGAHRIQVEFFEAGGEEILRVEVEGDGLARQTLESWLSPDGMPRQESAQPENSKELIEQGRRDFSRLGCAECHIKQDFKPTLPVVGGVLSATSEGGCLSAAAGTPNFSLDALQIENLQKMLASLNVERATSGDRSQIVNQQIDSTLVRFNCIACHQRGDFAGPESRHDALFTSTQPEMGDEGRLPPPLNGIGAKLRPEWLRSLLDRGAHDRFYMGVRMPGFGDRNVGQLVELLREADPLTEIPQVETNEPARRLKVAGRTLTGDQGQSCIKCHVFGDNAATGIQAISLTTMTRRLNEDWFLLYMLDPNALRPGTRMPQSWPGGATFFPKMLDGKANTQIHAVWTYLADGESAQTPSGIGSVGIELIPTDEPLIYRNFIEGAGARAIGVGYPERVHLAFDAEELRLALIWQGAFIDAGLHWSGRGVGFQRPLGDNVLQLSDGPGIAPLDDDQSPWPKVNVRDVGGRFRGYRFGEARRPEFIYSMHGREVSDQFEPLPDARFPGFLRTVTATGSSEQRLAVRIVSSGSIQQNDAGGFTTAEGLQIVPRAGTDLLVRESEGRGELLWVIPVGNDGIEGAWEYHW